MQLNPKFKNIFNIVGFYIGWWGCVLGAANDMSYLGPSLMLIFLIAHFYLFVSSNLEVYLILIICSLGTVIDTILFFSGSFVYAGAYSNELLIAPLWITAMWAGFAATVNHSMSWLKDKWALMVICGVVFGPAAFYTGEKFEAIDFSLSLLSSAMIIGFVYGVAMPGIYYLNGYLGLDE